MAYDVEKITIENAKIILKNFSANETKFDKKGEKRSFAVVIEDEVAAHDLKNQGWNVVEKTNKEGETFYKLPVEVSYKKKPPRIHMISGGRHTELDEESVGSLDYARFVKVDIVINPYVWDKDEHKIKAFLDELWVTIEPEKFSEKYRNLGVEGL